MEAPFFIVLPKLTNGPESKSFVRGNIFDTYSQKVRAFPDNNAIYSANFSQL